MIQARSLAQSIISLNPQQVKTAKQVNRTSSNLSQQQAAPAAPSPSAAPATDEQQLKDVGEYIASKAKEINNAKNLADFYDIVNKIPNEKMKAQYVKVLNNLNFNPNILIKNQEGEQNRVTSSGGFREKLLQIASELLNKRYGSTNQTQQSNQPAAQAPVTLIPTTPEAQAIAKTKIDINQPIPLFVGNASLLQSINNFIVKKSNGIKLTNPNIQDQFKQIIKDLVDQLKINGITNKQIQENFDFTQELLNETIVNRWKVLANIK
jgi:hypothetical protein